MVAAVVSLPQTSTVRIFVGAGMSIEVPRDAYDEALREAMQFRRVMFVGLTKTGCLVGSSAKELTEKGCFQLAFITPMDAAL
jgi:hypothetical protein